jgi:hypothetical protein
MEQKINPTPMSKKIKDLLCPCLFHGCSIDLEQILGYLHHFLMESLALPRKQGYLIRIQL